MAVFAGSRRLSIRRRCEHGSYGCGRPRDPELAERLFRKALELDPQLSTAHQGLGAHIDWMDRNLEGFEYGETLLATRPNDLGLLRSRAAGLLYEKRPDEAEQTLRKVASLAPTSIHDEWVSAGIELMRGNRGAADRLEAALEAAVADGPIPLREIDSAHLYDVLGDPLGAAKPRTGISSRSGLHDLRRAITGVRAAENSPGRSRGDCEVSPTIDGRFRG